MNQEQTGLNTRISITENEIFVTSAKIEMNKLLLF